MRRLLDPHHLGIGAVTYQLKPGPPATAADLRAARERGRLLGAELTRVREAATAWRNGLGGLLTALIVFSLIKGRSDIGQLATFWSALVGILLLAALITAAAGAVLLIRAANGRPFIAPTGELLSRSPADHIEALAAATALRQGIVLTLGCVAFLAAAVGATWYGPGRGGPALQITTPAGTFCGAVVGMNGGSLILQTASGQVTAVLGEASAVQVLARCP